MGLYLAHNLAKLILLKAGKASTFAFRWTRLPEIAASYLRIIHFHSPSFCANPPILPMDYEICRRNISHGNPPVAIATCHTGSDWLAGLASTNEAPAAGRGAGAPPGLDEQCPAQPVSYCPAGNDRRGKWCMLRDTAKRDYFRQRVIDGAPRPPLQSVKRAPARSRSSEQATA